MEKNWTIWFTGLSGSGKTTLSLMLYEKLKNAYKLDIIDGDIYRSLYKDKIGFSKEQRIQNINSISILAHYLNKYNINLIISSISPYYESRKYNRQLIEHGNNFLYNVYCKCDFNIRRDRDTKNLYNKNVISVNDEYEDDYNDADITVDTGLHSVDTCLNNILLDLTLKNLIDRKCFNI